MTPRTYVAPKIESISAMHIIESLGPVIAQGYTPPAPPCQTTCPMCANYCGGGC
jgi:hypothetical protein